MRFASTTAPVAAIALLAACARSADPCNPVHTRIATTYAASSSCASPVGVCTSGSIASGELAGTTQFTALTIRPGLSPNEIFYTGDLVISTASGTLTVHDFGTLNSATGAYSEVQGVVSGTDGYSATSGMLTSRGISTATGFEGDLNGTICQ